MSEERHPVDQLVDLLVYAPIGLLYERDDVLPRLVTRGRSQVQIARVLGQLAVRRGQGQLGDVLGSPAGGLARLVTELGALIGLAPPPERGTTDETAVPPAVLVAGPEQQRAATGPADVVSAGGTAGEAIPESAGIDEPGAGDVTPPSGGTAAEEPPSGAPGGGPASPPLPIAGYDRLPAREIIPRLADLSPAQRAVVRRHEAANRGRKTVLNQIDRLGT